MIMRATIGILLLASASSAMAEDITLVLSRWTEKEDRVWFKVPREELEKIPAWEPTDGKDAPLTRDQAVEIASKAAAAEGLDLPDVAKLTVTLEKPNPFEKDLVKRLPARGCLWFYMVRFGGGDMKVKDRYTFLVTMSGAVAAKNKN